MEMYQKDFQPIIIRSTVPPGTTKKVSEITGNPNNIFFMPEFLREGMALEDIRNPNKVVIGMCGEISAERIPKVVKEIYPPKKYRYIITNTETAEFIKYSQNIIYGLKISYINELQRLAEILERKGLRIDILKVYENFKVCRGVNPSFLKPGLGFSGPCLPKDIKGFLHYISSLGYTPNLIKSILRINKFSFENFIKRVIKMIKKHKIKKLGILGLTFKPETDEARNSHSIVIVKRFLQKIEEFFFISMIR